jgi:ankyrin repeat protein
MTGALLASAAGVSAGCSRHGHRALPDKASALHRAIAAKDLAAVEARLGSGDATKVANAVGLHGWTPLHLAAIYGAATVGKRLIARGAKVSALDKAQMTPLHWAARKGHLPLVELLLHHGADVRARNRYDQTPLHEARTQQIAALLLNKGAPIHARDIDGMTPLHRAPTRMVAQFLISKGASIRARAKDGRTPLDMPPTVRPRIR